MDDDLRASNKKSISHSAKAPVVERRKRAVKARKWFSKTIPTMECCAKTPDSQNDVSVFEGQSSEQKTKKKKKKKSKCLRGSCSKCCWCACKTGKRTSKKQIGAVDQLLRKGDVVDVGRRDADDVVGIMTPRRRENAKQVFDILSPRRSRDVNQNTGERLAPTKRRDAAVVPERMPPGPAREFSVPNPIVGQDVYLKTALSYLADDAFLSLSYTKITCLSEEIRELANLKYLELEGTTELRKIPHGVISSLEMLQAINLYMSGFANWNWLSLRGHDGITFEELMSLPRLRSVGFTVRNIPSLLRLFSIRCVSTHSLAIRELRGLISLHLLPALLSRSKMGRLKNLTIESSHGLKELVMGEEANDSSPNWRLHQLEIFNLVCLPELERVIWRGVMPHACLPNLRSLSLFYCNKLKNITWTMHLPFLQELYIQNCNEMEHIIAGESSMPSSEKEEKIITSFPYLKYIYLCNMKKLASINDQALAFPCLERILVCNCLELRKLPLGVQSAEKLRIIFGEKIWWESLEWEDESIKFIFSSCFREIPVGYEPNMKIFDGL
ncbi:disease resistance protein RPS2-like [Canna indica]|uniref:Disease resistance protein RPS2-like n=1 Tax=Canna indica TaxID=4628 RepID=A0AAQ3K8I8_9LILI|nr:disease resistance protein RPS2-like [Canna indica]